MIIPSKRKFFELWRAGVLGNRPLMWDTLEEALKHRPVVAKFGFRELGKAGGGAWELAPRAESPLVYDRWKQAGRRFVIDGSVPNDHSVAQGEVCRTEHGLQSFLCVRPEFVVRWPFAELKPGLSPMRITMAAEMHRHRDALETKLVLDQIMDPSSRDDLDMLLELYPDATVEFTCFDINVGVIPHRNTIFWEVRNY